MMIWLSFGLTEFASSRRISKSAMTVVRSGLVDSFAVEVLHIHVHFCSTGPSLVSQSFMLIIVCWVFVWLFWNLKQCTVVGATQELHAACPVIELERCKFVSMDD
jgi:hypothetical protein